MALECLRAVLMEKKKEGRRICGREKVHGRACCNKKNMPGLFCPGGKDAERLGGHKKSARRGAPHMPCHHRAIARASPPGLWAIPQYPGGLKARQASFKNFLARSTCS